MARRVLLISSSFEDVSLITATVGHKTGSKTTDDSHYPLGLAYLHSYLESHGHNVRTLFENNHAFPLCFNRIIDTIHAFAPEVIGIQILTANRMSSYRLIEHIHANYPEIQLVIGGIHTTAMYQQLLMAYDFLIAVLGEGEITFTELIQELALGSAANLYSIDGIAFISESELVVTRQRKLIEDLDDLPWPKHDLFFRDGKRTQGCVLTTRGCPSACSFCALHLVTNRRVRRRSVDSVIEEIEWMSHKFPSMTTIWIHDDTFLLDNEWVIRFCDEVVRRGLHLGFICSGRVRPLSSEVVARLERAKFQLVLLGLESGNEEILKAAHKGIRRSDVRRAFALFAKTSIALHAFLIVGLPGETIATVRETGRFVQSLQRMKYVHYRDGGVSALLTVYPGTEIYEIAKARGLLDDEYWLSDEPTPVFTVEHSFEELCMLQEVLTDYVSKDRLWTYSGFKLQVLMLPWIVRFSWREKRMVAEAAGALKAVLPGSVFRVVRVVYREVREGAKRLRV